jgi:putative Mg2+ transporter-C (MgtC) family protein
VPIAIADLPARAADLPSWDLINTVLRFDLLLKLGLAVILGGAIGIEREIKAKPAGLRTNILICIGACLITDVSVRIGNINGVRVGDPARLAAQIVSGIGFIGAGTIMQGGGVVTGLTSAATIWVVAALGICIGAGYYIEAAGAGALVTIVLAWLGRVEHKIRRVRRIVHFTVKCRPGTSVEDLRDALGTEGIRVVSFESYDHPDDRTFELRLIGPAIQFETAPDKLLARQDVLSVHGG